jgi:hypothetical protein
VRHTALLPVVGINGRPSQAMKIGQTWVTVNSKEPIVFINGVAYTQAAYKQFKKHLKATAWNFNLKK